ncbi:MAG: DegT/DnrJ/EryC1/StrS family aminotransferase [Betaproteobacteria bacterium]
MSALPLDGSINESVASRLGLPRLPVFGWSTFAAAKEANLPCILDQPNKVYTSSGRAAIAVALRDLGVGRGDSVLVPTYHCPTMIAPIVSVGARPLFFPLDAAGTPRIDVLATLDLSNVRAMIAAHYFGIPQPMARIRKFCDDRNVALIEDCAHAMFGQAEGRPIGTWGDYAIASLTKFLPTTDGGCLIFARRPANPPQLRQRSMTDELRIAANSLEIGARHGGLRGVNRPLASAFAFAARLRGGNPLPAAPVEYATDRPRAAAQLLAEFAPEGPVWQSASAWSRWIAGAAHRQRIVATRRRNYLHLAALLANLPGTRVLRPDLPEFAAPYVFPLWVDAPARIYQRVRNAGIPVFRWDDVWQGVPMIAGDCGSDWSVHLFQLGCHQDLRLDDLARMADTLRDILAAAET